MKRQHLNELVAAQSFGPVQLTELNELLPSTFVSLDQLPCW